MSVTAAQGFVAAGVHAGIRRDRKDVALVVASHEATGAAMWTQNRVQAAPVVVSKANLELAQPRAVVVNSGVANAATGAQGVADAIATAEHAAQVLGLAPEEVVVLSTGVIGAPVPLERVCAGIDEASARLSADGGADAADAILTTDTRAKEALYRGSGFTVGGMAKGSGMIHPNLATMLAVLTTDYPLEPGEAIGFLRPAVDASFNSISVDGECSTNDAVVLLASGAADIERTPATDAELSLAVRTVCAELAQQIVGDGEGATLLAEIAVSGAASAPEARAIAQRIATSALVKTALFGRDANWGRGVSPPRAAPGNTGYPPGNPHRGESK
jgi:glutamate N-acetyltransferase/amino-acid N-acetyltransferase